MIKAYKGSFSELKTEICLLYIYIYIYTHTHTHTHTHTRAELRRRGDSISDELRWNLTSTLETTALGDGNR
jgi:hypothetical protein